MEELCGGRFTASGFLPRGEPHIKLVLASAIGSTLVLEALARGGVMQPRTLGLVEYALLVQLLGCSLGCTKLFSQAAPYLLTLPPCLSDDHNCSFQRRDAPLMNIGLCLTEMCLYGEQVPSGLARLGDGCRRKLALPGRL